MCECILCIQEKEDGGREGRKIIKRNRWFKERRDVVLDFAWRVESGMSPYNMLRWRGGCESYHRMISNNYCGGLYSVLDHLQANPMS